MKQKMVRMRKNRKGAVSDILVIMIIIFTVALTMVIGAKIYSETNDAIQSSSTFPNRSKVLMDTMDSKIGPLFNGMFLFLFVGIVIGGVVLASRVEVTPAFFIMGIIVFVIAIALAAIFTNIYEKATGLETKNDTLVKSNELTSTANRFGIMNNIMGNFPIYMLIPGTLILIVLYAKVRRGGI